MMKTRSRWLGAGILLTVFILLAVPFNNCSSPKSGSKGSSNGSSGGPGPCTTAACGNAQAIFTTVVKPVFESRCRSCHNLPLNGGTAPITIFDYATAKAHLSNGTTSANNHMINKAIGSLNHTNTCSAGLAQSPCKDILQWWEAEFGKDASGQNIGAVTSINEMGVVYGWAVNAQSLGASVDIEYYGDGPEGVGTLLGTGKANLEGNSGYSGNHMFKFELPPNFRNGVAHQLYVYIVTNSRKYSLQGTPATYTAFTPRAAGLAYFNSTVAPAFQTNCGSCHAFSYNVLYSQMLNPLPTNGGTSMNNFLINKIGGTAAHSGGNRCGGGKNTPPCSLVQEWWRLEFQ